MSEVGVSEGSISIINNTIDELGNIVYENKEIASAINQCLYGTNNIEAVSGDDTKKEVGWFNTITMKLKNILTMNREVNKLLDRIKQDMK